MPNLSFITGMGARHFYPEIEIVDLCMTPMLFMLLWWMEARFLYLFHTGSMFKAGSWPLFLLMVLRREWEENLDALSDIFESGVFTDNFERVIDRTEKALPWPLLSTADAPSI